MNESDAYAAAAGIYVVAIIFAYVISGLFYHFLFTKIGIASWRAWVPLANTGALLGAGGFNPWLAALLLVPGVNIVPLVMLYIAQFRVGKGLNMSDALNIVGLVFGFWIIGALVTPGPYDHRRTGVASVQSDQMAAIAAGGLVDPAMGYAGAYGQAGYSQGGYNQNQQY